MENKQLQEDLEGECDFYLECMYFFKDLLRKTSLQNVTAVFSFSVELTSPLPRVTSSRILGYGQLASLPVFSESTAFLQKNPRQKKTSNPQLSADSEIMG